MPDLASIMTTDVVTIEPEMSLREALEILRGANVTGAPVVSGSAVVGVISGTDILEFEATNPGVPTGDEQREPWTELPEPEAWEEGTEPPGSYFVELWPGSGVGVWERMEESDGPEWDLLEGQTVAEIMTRQLLSLPSDASIRDAARLMLRAGVHRIVVLDDHTLKGIVTTTDIVRAVAQHGF